MAVGIAAFAAGAVLTLVISVVIYLVTCGAQPLWSEALRVSGQPTPHGSFTKCCGSVGGCSYGCQPVGAFEAEYLSQ